MHRSSFVLLATFATFAIFATASVQAADVPAPAVPATAAAKDLDRELAALPVVDEVRIGGDAPGHHFTQIPEGCSRIETCLGAPCRVLPIDGAAKGFGVRLGEGKLTPRGTYVLEIEFPEDSPRTFFIANRGDNSARGVACGSSICDALQVYTQTNPESLDLPLSKSMRTWRSVFRLHDRFADLKGKREKDTPEISPENGFWVIICQSEGARHPGSHGAAVANIRLRALEHPEALDVTLHRPPEGMPWRHLFWREEMADGVIGGDDAAKRGFVDPVDWYADKVHLMRFLGIDTFTKDLLEFGHNQGWDSTPYGSNDWVYQTKTPDLWERIVTMMGKEGIPVLPYYEYCGSIGVKGFGLQKRATPLNGKPSYTHITWSERATVDVSDPETGEDFAKILDCTVFRLKERARFLGVWLRNRPSNMPVGFADATLARFSAKANHSAAVTRAMLASDKALLQRYYDWWFEQRRDFLIGVRERLSAAGIVDPIVLFSPQTGEPAPAIDGDALVVRGDVEAWKTLLAKSEVDAKGKPKGSKRPVRAFDAVIAKGEYRDAVTDWATTWGGWEWQHATPPADPKRYTTTPGVMIAYPFNRAYTVSDPTAIAPFRSPAGLAMVRHHPLNERTIPDEMFGYLCIDTEYAGPFCMLGEVLAMANGDPTHLAELTGAVLTRGFPTYVRNFDAAFLALPALPSELVEGEAPAPGVVVRRIDGGAHGWWLVVCNTATVAHAGVSIPLPDKAAAKAVDAATELPLTVKAGAVTLDLEPCSLHAVHCTR